MELPRFRLFPTLCLIVAAYFVYHSIQGARGYRRLYQVRQEIVLSQEKANEIRSRKLLLEKKVKSLSPESLDMDQLEESALRILNMGPSSDQIVLSP